MLDAQIFAYFKKMLNIKPNNQLIIVCACALADIYHH